MNHRDAEIENLAEKIALSARELSGQIDHDRRLPDELVASLNGAGLLRATMPREVDALELAPGVALRCAEAIARGDASAGWCVSIAITSALLVAYLPASSREEMFGGGPRNGHGVAAGVWAPRGTARSVDGGVVVSGRWPFCSGISHADMMFAGCFIDDQRVPSVVALPKADLKVLDTWHTLGLRGTGSHDSVADDVFVPADRVLSVFDGPVLDRPLYRFPVFGFFALSIGAAALGNARAAIDDLVELAGGKKGLGSARTLAERPSTQAAVATAEAALGAARALYYQAIDAAWQASHDTEPVPVALRNRLRLAATHAARTSADVVRTMYDLAGGTAIYDSSPLQRRFRDAFTATAHFQVNEASRELPGRLLLDQPADVSML
ncbi:acyl-CoA dehydrogenase family protein [Mycobacterium kansasii]|uniref:Flavin-dependent monooxygenase, oxygenase subunit HsaA n=3 Tax=Mycobacterium kansasii TaxID=1768 RepID=A0A653ERV2_MYCKA|nr:acyl-CoA dehydrogenase family protein [Mycobacterium kansasii]EUA03422.1 acyl-CoA dehydrogenase, C-terminal domain protein [Mycobacterium kansasii 824]AGZ52783.1 hydroxylase [Mycobacterium kansasii ATCC 12478]ARG61006.1 hydroxylase [Mycobacterium kansasii]ARG68715.1 hydroxylase [Mycobacterium kansasii]ARG76682.1 hydroxylase [Mycobacterium kansasii]